MTSSSDSSFRARAVSVLAEAEKGAGPRRTVTVEVAGELVAAARDALERDSTVRSTKTPEANARRAKTVTAKKVRVFISENRAGLRSWSHAALIHGGGWGSSQFA